MLYLWVNIPCRVAKNPVIYNKIGSILSVNVWRNGNNVEVVAVTIFLGYVEFD